MNRLVIIGNGFDLAHGIKSSYYDFIRWYLDQAVRAAAKQGYADGLITIELTHNDFYAIHALDYSKLVDEILTVIPKTTVSEFTISLFLISFESDLLYLICKDCANLKWVDIENRYYEELVRQVSSNAKNPVYVKKLNDSLILLKESLERYLINVTVQTPFMPKMVDSICGYLFPADFIDQEIGNSNYPEEICILNFNYTWTPYQYISDMDNCSMINIHGRLNEQSNPMIFGYGDEQDDSYLPMEKLVDNEYFKLLKSFWYQETDNYKTLLRFLRKDLFEVRLIGHSCGLSDRTMLSTIFRDVNCKAVRPYYHGDVAKNNYTDIIHNLSRHFTDKACFREIVVSKQNCKSVAQLGD